MAREHGRERATAEAVQAPDAWRPSELQRGYRAVLDSAKDVPQLIFDTDGSILVIEPKEQADFAHAMVERLADVAQFRAAYTAHADEPAARWASETPYPFVAALDPGEVADFARELLGFALDAAQRHTLEFFEGNLRAWRSTAEVYESPDQLAALLAPIDMSEVAEVFPPSQRQAREAAADAA
jgi:23S rRNA G2069 N7-methylase RlmK/C1962 C5-methylase RlmI